MNQYIGNHYTIMLTYIKGELSNVSILPVADIIDWEAIRHEIPYYEEQLDKEKYILTKIK